jgi:hypothetical protein
MTEKRQENALTERLAELRAASAELEASPRVKTRVMDAYREAQATRRPSRAVGWRWALAAAAALVVCVPGALWFISAARMAAPPAMTTKLAPPPVALSSAVTDTKAEPKPKTASPRRVAARRPVRPAAPRPQREVATDFLALPFAPPLDASEGGHVVRVSLPRSAMQAVGLPVNEDRWYERVPADVLLGQDGVARAVRFVKFSQ